METGAQTNEETNMLLGSNLDDICCGDVIAFCHPHGIGRMIMRATDSSVTHVGIVLGSNSRNSLWMFLLEAVPRGVVINCMLRRLKDDYDTIWHLPLSTESRCRIDIPILAAFAAAVVGRPYDFIQAAKSAFDRRNGNHGITYAAEDETKFFCSELVAAALEAARVIPEVNSSEVTPIDVCSWNIYAPEYRTLVGDRRLEQYNDHDPSDWNV